MNTPAISTPNRNGLVQIWNKLSDFLHHAQLIPLVIVVEAWHYYAVLSSHDHLLAAVPLALFLDLLHFRTVQQAIETKKKLWWVGAALSTAVAYAFQYIFYSAPGQDGHTLLLWKQLLFAAVVPLGVTFMVWHHHENKQKVVRDWQDELTQANDDLERLEEALRRTEGERDLAQDGGKLAAEALTVAQDELVWQTNERELVTAELTLKRDALKEVQDELKRATAERDVARDGLKVVQDELKAVTAERDVAQDVLKMVTAERDSLQEVGITWQKMNRRSQLAALVNAEKLGVEEGARLAGVSATTMRRDAGRMKGAGG